MKTMIPGVVLSFAVMAMGCNADSGKLEEKRKHSEEDSGKSAMIFHRTHEPSENAFTFLLPQGWSVTGGITRVNPDAAGGSGNAVEAKLYMKLSSPDQKAGMGWLPDTRFFDMQRYPGHNLAAPMFPDGSNYNGMTVMRIPNPASFISEVAFPFAHPHAEGLSVTQLQPLPELAVEFSDMSAKMLGGYRFTYQVVIATLEYSEGGIQYIEKMVCAIEDWGQMGGGLWSNKETWYVRAEKTLFESYVPVFATIGQSVKLNPDWIAREIRSQQINSNIALKTQSEIARIDKEITQHRAHTNSEINNDMYLNLTGQEDYTNPFTGETERGTNEWKYRWENDLGDVVYHNNENYNPNEDADFKVKGFRRSGIRKR